MHCKNSLLNLAILTTLTIAKGQTDYQPCPLLRAYYPAPNLDKSSDAVQNFAQEFTSVFDSLIESSGSDDFGAITPNTTSFSVVLFSGSDSAGDDPIIFEYHHTATRLETAEIVTAQTVFPIGTLTQLFTVYAWLVVTADGSWASPITEFLPELKQKSPSTSGYDIDLVVDWESITVGSLASHMSGLVRNSDACNLVEACDKQAFVEAISVQVPYFLADTTPIISNAAFQLLAYAIETRSGQLFSDYLAKSILEPSNMTQSGLLRADTQVFGDSLNFTATGEQAALSLYTSTSDLARAGHAMLSSLLVTPDQTRRWLQPVSDTSNLRNGVGRPWEIYHAGKYANSSILDVYTKTGTLRRYSSYFGLAPDFDAGFAILAHDIDGNPDLNVYADVVSLALLTLAELASKEAAAMFAGEYAASNGSSYAVLNVTDEGPGLVVSQFVVNGSDIRSEAAVRTGIEIENLDMRLYPSNVVSGSLRQFVAVFQDRSALVDMGTPTCITWMDVGTLQGIPTRYIIEVDDSEVAVGLRIPDRQIRLEKS
ncbi:hypothetical protein PFICI_15109 [Pestalotiopsis fici W106-1]|uniref:Uncharacterized protein n=1 Tax=Pestalotiopsis fici (strain W106-1 / CGMCC3.15140) TaxID=1229662 RepID=W3WH94_PESFW|nr:uncharacterized protein PFICI_15109 [Pestalotiopsis fici W106-1]ETS73164.1 hypothetical protein PFICI_15109 [Pestalotiopsis fici W106-1]